MSKKFIVACGGTGGHTFPGLAVARELKARGHDVVVWASGRSIEGSVMKAWDGAVFSTGARQLRARHVFANLFSILRCRAEMKRFAPDALLAMGSYSSLPPVLAARAYSVPVVLHEANTVPGRAVEFLARSARKVAISFEETKEHLRGHETVLTGLPVRAEIVGQPRLDEVPADAFCVFVTGGGGFGGCTINLVKDDIYDKFVEDVTAKFTAKYGHAPEVYPVVMSEGSHKVC